MDTQSSDECERCEECAVLREHHDGRALCGSCIEAVTDDPSLEWPNDATFEEVET